jgi:phenylacetate-CoA ligase
MQDFGTTVLVATPSYALYLAESIQKLGAPDGFKLRLGLFGAEACSEEMRPQIESRIPISATDNYGLTEVMGPGVSGECEHRSGMHVAEDHFIVEVARPGDGRADARGRGRRARLQLGDARVFTGAALPHPRPLQLTTGRCECGRTLARMGKIVGRTDDMFIISGVNVFPSAIERVLFAIEGIEPHYQIVLAARARSTPSRCRSRSPRRSSTAGWTTCAPSSGGSPRSSARRCSCGPR